MCHAQCTHLVPDFCGMSLQMANEILATIESTKVSPKKAQHQQSHAKPLPPKPPIESKPSMDSEETLHNEPSYKSLRPASVVHQDTNFVSKLPTTVQNKYQEPVELPPQQQNQVVPSTRRRGHGLTDLSFETGYGQQQHQHHRDVPQIVVEDHQHYNSNDNRDVEMEESKDEFDNFDYNNKYTENEILTDVQQDQVRSPLLIKYKVFLKLLMQNSRINKYNKYNNKKNLAINVLILQENLASLSVAKKGWIR